MTHCALLFLGCVILLSVQPAFAVSVGGGRGGPYIEYHSKSLSAFDSDISGNPVLIGGYGFGYTSKKFRLGGGGGGGFLMNGSENVQFGLGYGGVVGEYVITKALNVRLLIGGGGYGIVKIVSETETQRIIQKISTGAFFLFYPTINFDIKVTKFSVVSMGLGYFLPNVNRLDSITFHLCFIMGKT